MISLLPVLLIVIPVVTGVAARLARSTRLTEGVSAGGGVATLAVASLLAIQIAQDGPQQALDNVLYLDVLSAVMIVMIAGVGCAAALVSVGYMRRDFASGHLPEGRKSVAWYYLGLHLFIASMLVTVSVDNLGLLWVGIEATTFASALLVGFYRTRQALEAAWKYLILCTVGITLALFGVLATYYAAIQAGGEGISGLNWTTLSFNAGQLDPEMMRLAFIFVLVGFGTKAGFAPLHTWLADAHSLAPSPVSGLLSGVLLSCALYGVLRFHAITVGAVGPEFSSRLLLIFGVVSVLVSVPFIIVQRDLKRLLAYSSVEHVGLMAIAFGIGGPLGVYAGVLHMVNHAATKALLFFVVGDIVQRFGTRRISAIRGILRTTPFAGWLFLAGIFAITGAPPFGIFVSELSIVTAGFAGNREEIAAGVAVIVLISLIFAGLLAHTLRLSYGSEVEGKPLLTARPARAENIATGLAIVPLLGIMLVFGIYVPGPLSDVIQQVASVLQPVTLESAR